MIPLIEFKNISKTFGQVQANHDVSFSIKGGNIHGIVGENGAGKSTIMKILYGLYPADSGEIFLKGSRADLRSPMEAIRLGIGMVHQHFMLVPTLSVWQNIILGKEPTLARLNTTSIKHHLTELQSHYGFHLNLEIPVEELSVGQQQQVEILKLLYREAHILILDEPTAVLTPQEVEGLFLKLKALQARGKTILLISHKLKEILSFTHEVTVMRRGKVITTEATSSLSEHRLAELIVGRPMVPLSPPPPVREGAAPILAVENLSVVSHSPGSSGVNGVTFSIRSGEILGIAGVEGNGQQELIEVLSGVSAYGGSVGVESHEIREFSTYRLKQEGLAVIPPDRHQEAIVLSFSVKDNLFLGHQRETDFTNGPRLNYTKINTFAQQAVDTYDIRPRDFSISIAHLSGGNQQKVVIAREFSRQVKLLVAAHPTRGVDIGATQFIHSQFIRLREEGAAILLVSSELEEILALADRILVFFKGKVQGEVQSRKTSERELGTLMCGGAHA